MVEVGHDQGERAVGNWEQAWISKGTVAVSDQHTHRTGLRPYDNVGAAIAIQVAGCNGLCIVGAGIIEPAGVEGSISVIHEHTHRARLAACHRERSDEVSLAIAI